MGKRKHCFSVYCCERVSFAATLIVMGMGFLWSIPGSILKFGRTGGLVGWLWMIFNLIPSAILVSRARVATLRQSLQRQYLGIQEWVYRHRNTVAKGDICQPKRERGYKCMLHRVSLLAGYDKTGKSFQAQG